MKRLFFLAFFTFIFSSLVFCFDGIMAGQKNLRIVKTTYFDIIYTPQSEESAKELFKNADKIFEELAESLELKHAFRLPVVISASQDDFNAYFSSAPFNHIVLFDTVPSQNLAVFSQEFLSTFRHELTHAITYNLYNNFWFNFDRIFGTTYNPALLTVTMGFAEGAAVAMESLHGEGRLNDDFSLQIIRQAKIEGKFPTFAEIQGSRDIYPSGTVSYLFGGAFSQWLQNEFGMQKFAQFWYSCVNAKKLTYLGSFKKVYGISIKTAWNQFYNSIEVPEVVTIPKEKLNSKKDAFSSLSKSPNGFAWYEPYSKKVKFKEFSSNSKAKTLYKQANLEKISFSSDGIFLAESYSSQKYRTPKNKIRIFRMNKNNSAQFYLEIPQKSLRDAAIITKDGKYFVAAVKTNSAKSSLCIFELDTKTKKISKEAIYEKTFPTSEQLFSLQGSSNGNLFYVLKDYLNFKIIKFSLADFSTTEYTILEEPNAVIHNISLLNEDVYFSFTTKNSLPRLGILKTNQENPIFMLQEKDFSGGVHLPVALNENSTKEEKIAFISEFFLENKIFIASQNDFSFVQKTPKIEKSPAQEESSLQFAKQSSNGEDVNVQETEKSSPDEATAPQTTENSAQENIFTESSKPFSAFTYGFTGPHGTFIPFSMANSYSVKSLFSVESTSLPLGITYVSSTPWTNPIYYISAGYNPLTNSEAIFVSVQGGTLTQLFLYSGSASVEFDTNGYKQTFGQLNFSSKIPLLGIFYTGFSEKAYILEGKQSLTEIPEEENVDSIWDYIGILKTNSKSAFFAEQNFTASLGSIHKSGIEHFNYEGLEFSATLKNNFYSLVEDFSKNNTFNNISVGINAWNSLLIPFNAQAVLFPSQNYVVAFLGKAYLFTHEIQKSPNFFPIIYWNRISFCAQYFGKFKEDLDSWAITKTDRYISDLFSENCSYYDEASLMAQLEFTPNLGGLARSAFCIYSVFGAHYRFFKEENQKRFVLSLSFNTNL